MALFQALDAELEALGDGAERSDAAERSFRVMLTFYPHPGQVIRGVLSEEANEKKEFWHINSFRQKFELAKHFGFDAVFAIHFTKKFSSLSAEAFIKQYLVGALQAKVVVVGHDWAFGKGRSGNTEMLSSMGKQYGFRVRVVEPVLVDGSRVSSTQVKDALRDGNIQLLTKLLGRKFALSGKIIAGDNRGTQLGYPTANMKFVKQHLPKDGIYATVAVVEGVLCPSVTYVGTRPTYGEGERFVEVHLLGDERPDLYGKRVSVKFVDFVRDDETFSTDGELQAAIASDIKKTERILKTLF